MFSSLSLSSGRRITVGNSQICMICSQKKKNEEIIRPNHNFSHITCPPERWGICLWKLNANIEVLILKDQYKSKEEKAASWKIWIMEGGRICLRRDEDEDYEENIEKWNELHE